MNHVAQRSPERAVERPAGGKRQIVSLRSGVDVRLIPAHDLRPSHLIGEGDAVITRDLDLVAGLEVAEEAEMRVAMRGEDHRAALAGLRRRVEMAGSESERLAAAARDRKSTRLNSS